MLYSFEYYLIKFHNNKESNDKEMWYILKSLGHGQDACLRNNKAGKMPRQISLTYPLHLSFSVHNYIILITKSRHHHMKDEINFQKEVIPEYDASWFVSNWKSIWHIYGFSLVINQQVYMSNSFVRMCIQDTNSLVDISLLWSESLAHITSSWIKWSFFMDHPPNFPVFFLIKQITCLRYKHFMVTINKEKQTKFL